MKLLIQRVKEASVMVDGVVTGSVGHGALVFVGVSEKDTTEIADKMIDKMVKLRIFEDENGKTNKAIADAGGNFLVVSQFTLYADCRKGNRPSFGKAGNPQIANELYEHVLKTLRERGFEVGAGVFGADMKVSLVNDGPFTVMLDSEEIVRKS
jgi:D-tyrosyl-tRNA(Tyr) deacylase